MQDDKNFAQLFLASKRFLEAEEHYYDGADQRRCQEYFAAREALRNAVKEIQQSIVST